MKRLQPLVFSAALLVLAACGENTQPESATPSFNFSIDPGSETVSLTRADAAALGTLQDGDSDDPRILFPDEELALTAYDAVFLPGNILEITAEFTNVTECTFEQPFTFTRADSTSNIVSSQEPEVTDADLGGDGELSPDETTSTLTFTVEHMGQPFTYEVFAEAVVRCGDDGEEPGPIDPGPGDDEADLEVVKTGDAEVTFGEDGSATVDFNVIVRNNGTLDAENVVLTDTLIIDLADLVGVEATITAGTPLPAGCVVDATVAEGNVLICTIGTVAGGTEQSFDFSFDIDLLGELPATLEGVTITNTAEVVTDTEETDLENNIDVVVTVPADDGSTPVEPGAADLVVTKTGDAEVTTGDDGTATLNYTVVVTNDSTVDATGVELTDTLTIDLTGLGITAELAANALLLPEGCTVDATVADVEVVVCAIGDLAAGASETINLSFDLALLGDLTTITGPITVTNTADVSSDTDDADGSDNLVDFDTAVTVPAPVVPELADLTVTKTGDTAVTTDADGNATLDYTVIVTNNGDAVAEGVELTDTFAITLEALDTVDFGATVLPDGCILSAEGTVDDTLVAICTLGALEGNGGTSTLNFSFAFDLPADVAAGDLPVTNTATADTTTTEEDLTDNTAIVNATVTVPALPAAAAGM